MKLNIKAYFSGVTVVKLLLELFVVFIGVFLGIIFTNLNEERVKKKSLIEVQKSIEKEIYNNCRILSNELPRCYASINSLYSICDELEEKQLFSQHRRYRGITYAEPNNIAWLTAKESPVFHELEYNRLLELNMIYQQLEITAKGMNITMGITSNPDSNDPLHQQKMLYTLIDAYRNYFAYLNRFYYANLNYLRKYKTVEYTADSSFVENVDSTFKVEAPKEEEYYKKKYRRFNSKGLFK